MATIHIMCAELPITLCTYTVFNWIVRSKPIVIAEEAKTADKKKNRSGIVIFTMSPIRVTFFDQYSAITNHIFGTKTEHRLWRHHARLTHFRIECKSNFNVFLYEISVVRSVWPIEPDKMCHTKCFAIWINIRLNFWFISENWADTTHGPDWNMDT